MINIAVMQYNPFVGHIWRVGSRNQNKRKSLCTKNVDWELFIML